LYKKLLYLLTILTAVTITLKAQAGNVSVKTWADDKQSAFSFTFDDGFLSQYEIALPILNSYGFKGTFFVITSQLTPALPGYWRYGSWEQFREIARQGHEIGSHTVTHPDLLTIPAGNKTTPGTIHYEFYQSKVEIEYQIPEIKVLTVAYPYITHNSEVDKIADKYYEAGRTGGNTLNNSILSNNNRLGLFAKKVEFQLPRNSMQDDEDDMIEFKNYIQSSISDRKWGAIMIHELYPFSQLQHAIELGAYYPMTAEWFTELCEFLKEKSDNNEVWVETAANILKYSRERETFKSNVVTQNNSLIELSVSDDLDDSVYDYPLTVDIVVPNDWLNVRIKQNGNEVTALSYNNGLNRVVRTYITPDKGNVILEKISESEQLYTVTGSIMYADFGKVVSGVSIILPDADKVTTNDQGEFRIENLANGNYQFNFSKSDNWGGVNATDALWALLYFTSSAELDTLQILAADVTNDGKVNATDALLILRRFSGLINNFERPDWIFNPASIDAVINGKNENYEIYSICAGDVNKSFVP